MKRVRNNHQKSATFRKMSAGLLCEWENASAEIVQDPAVNDLVNNLIHNKYGMIKRILDWREKSSDLQYGIMKIELDGIKYH